MESYSRLWLFIKIKYTMMQMHYAYGCTKINSTFSKAFQRRNQQPFEAHLRFLKYVLIGYIHRYFNWIFFQFFHPFFLKTCLYISCNYKLQQLYGILSKFNNSQQNVRQIIAPLLFNFFCGLSHAQWRGDELICGLQQSRKSKCKFVCLLH